MKQDWQKERKKVLYVITKSNWGGAQRYVFDLATSLPQDQFEVSVACGDARKNTEGLPGILVQRLQARGIRVILVPSFTRDISIWRDFSALRELVTLFQHERPDVVHLNSSKAGGLGALAARLTRVPKIVFTSHGLAWDEDRNFIFKSFIYLASQLTFMLCHKVITISKDTHSRVSKSTLIYNGIAPINFRPREEARRRIMGQPIRDTVWIGSVAEFTRNKGLTYLVEAASLLKKRGLTFRFVLIGDGEDLPKIKKLAMEKGLYNAPNSNAHIDLPGYVPDIADSLKAFEILVLPSVKEGLPYVLLEAGQAGCAVVGSNIPGISDVVGDTGILVPPKDSVALATGLEQLLKDQSLRNNLGTELEARVRSQFSLERMVRETAALYLPAQAG
jgi:glycosyltransferase involved in cell wall biosynthesis